ncbi:MAG: dihydrolipoamide acetyltransferase family protein [Acetobacteraceae bacterium]
MGRYVFTLPDVGEGIAEVEVVAWHVAVGTTVKEDAPLVDVLTEKATVEIPSPRSGRVLSITGNPGDKLRVGSEILILETDAADVGALRPAPQPIPEAPAPAASVPFEPERESRKVEYPRGEYKEHAAPPSVSPSISPKPLAAPSVRYRAKQLGIELASISGTGPGGRILHADLDAVLAARKPPSAVVTAPASVHGEEEVEEIRIIGLRRRIAERMQQSKRRIPHYSYVEEIDVSALEELRADLNLRYSTERPRLTVLPFLIAALVRAVPKFPQINALFDDEQGILRRYRLVHVGIATETGQGLLVPVIRHVEKLDLWQTALEISRLSTAAREGRAGREELSGSTITISSLGPLGGIVATPIINPPEVAIIGVNRIAARPVVRDGAIVIRRMMNLSSSFDHRIVDGFDAAQFTQEMKRLIEQPATLFVR